MTVQTDPVATAPVRTPRETLGLLGIALLALWPFQYLATKAVAIVLYKTGLYRPTDWRDLNFGDFDAFVVAGQLMRAGRAACLYSLDCVGQVQGAYSGLDPMASRMTWNYPPPMDLAVLPLAWMSPSLAYTAFLLVNLSLIAAAAYLLHPRRTALPASPRDPLLTGLIQALPMILFATAPGVVTGTAIGQNGLLLGAIASLGLWLIARSPLQAGLVLGLLIVKPHLAVLLPFVVLGQRRIQDAADLAIGAIVTVALFCAIALAAFGSAPWFAFLDGLGDTRALFVAGGYPRSQITSLYVSLVALGLPEPAALAAQGLAWLGVGGLLVAIWRGVREARVRIALTLMALPLASPYAYYYDLVPWTFGLALLMQRRLQHAGPDREALALWSLAAIPWIGILLNDHLPLSRTAAWPVQPVGVLLIAGFAAVALRNLRRPPTLTSVVARTT
jgi:hypothetical protein